MVHKGVGQVAEFLAGLAIGDARAIRKIKKKRALSQETAKKPAELGVHESVLREFKKRGLVKETEDGRYYLSK